MDYKALFSAGLQSIFRGLLWSLATYIVGRGWWTEPAAKLYVEAGSVVAVSLIWSLYQAWKKDNLIAYLQDALHWHQFQRIHTNPPPTTETPTP